MLEAPLEFPSGANLAQVRRAIERACLTSGLTLTLKGTQRQYPGCTHWHYKRGKERGTLEITLWPQTRRAWFKVAVARTGDWIEPAIVGIQQLVAADLKRQA